MKNKEIAIIREALRCLSSMILSLAIYPYKDCEEQRDEVNVCDSCRLHMFCRERRQLEATVWQLEQEVGD